MMQSNCSLPGSDVTKSASGESTAARVLTNKNINMDMDMEKATISLPAKVVKRERERNSQEVLDTIREAAFGIRHPTHGHSFARAMSPFPVSCAACSRKVWSPFSTVCRCLTCGIPVHRKCATDIGISFCRGEKSKSPSFFSSPEMSEKNYLNHRRRKNNNSTSSPSSLSSGSDGDCSNGGGLTGGGSASKVKNDRERTLSSNSNTNNYNLHNNNSNINIDEGLINAHNIKGHPHHIRKQSSSEDDFERQTNNNNDNNNNNKSLEVHSIDRSTGPCAEIISKTIQETKSSSTIASRKKKRVSRRSKENGNEYREITMHVKADTKNDRKIVTTVEKSILQTWDGNAMDEDDWLPWIVFKSLSREDSLPGKIFKALIHHFQTKYLPAVPSSSDSRSHDNTSKVVGTGGDAPPATTMSEIIVKILPEESTETPPPESASSVNRIKNDSNNENKFQPNDPNSTEDVNKVQEPDEDNFQDCVSSESDVSEDRNTASAEKRKTGGFPAASDPETNCKSDNEKEVHAGEPIPRPLAESSETKEQIKGGQSHNLHQGVKTKAKRKNCTIEHAHYIIHEVILATLEFLPTLRKEKTHVVRIINAVDRIVFTEMYPSIYGELAEEAQCHESALSKRLAHFRQYKLVERVPAKAVEMLELSTNAYTALDKVKCLVKTLEYVAESFHKEESTSAVGRENNEAVAELRGSADDGVDAESIERNISSISADDLLPVLAQVIVEASKIPNIIIELLFIEEFSRDEFWLSGVEGYSLISVQAALRYVMTVDVVGIDEATVSQENIFS